jgi:hypothetical protein
MTSENHSPSAITEFAAEPNYVIVHIVVTCPLADDRDRHARVLTGRERITNHAEYLSRSGAPGGYSRGWWLPVRICPAVSQVQARSVCRSAAAMRGGPVRGAPACRRAAWLTGARTSVSGAGCITCNQSGWVPGRARGAANDAEVRRVPRSCGAGRAPVAEPGDDAPGATGCSRVHRGASRCNDDAGHATESAASSLHQIQADCEVPGHRSRAARPAGRGHRRAARCAAGSACSRELQNVASDATPRPSIRVPSV